MSNLWIARVRKHSPYEKTAKLIHLLMADSSDDDGSHFVHQQTLAEECGCTVGYVEQVIARMKRDGLLTTIRIKYKTIYILQDPTPANHTPSRVRTPLHLGSQPHSTLVETHTPVGLHIEPPMNPQLPLNDSKNPRASGAGLDPEADVIPGQLEPDDQEPALTTGRRTGKHRPESNRDRDDLQRKVGGLAPDDPTETEASPIVTRIPRGTSARSQPRPGTFDAVVAYFSVQARLAGHHEFNLGALRKTITRLRDKHGYSYPEIEKLMRVFFLRHEHEVRTTTTNLVYRFNDLIPTLMKESKDSIRNTREGLVANADVVTDYSSQIEEWKAAQNA